jgi:hypothetical protein
MRRAVLPSVLTVGVYGRSPSVAISGGVLVLIVVIILLVILL